MIFVTKRVVVILIRGVRNTKYKASSVSVDKSEQTRLVFVLLSKTLKAREPGLNSAVIAVL